jgi:hypothetical protein
MSKLMKGFVAGLMVVGLLAVSAPAKAQGLGDPLTLAASGVLIPFFGATSGDVSLLEVSSPVGPNPVLHFIFYNAACTRVESFPTQDTTNDTDLYRAASFGPGSIVTGVDGLIAIAADAGDGINMKPLPITGPLHTRLYHFNVSTHLYRVLEPIILNMAESPSATNTWHPLRSGATFFAPQEGIAGGLKTTLYFVCPKDTIQGIPASDTTSAFQVNRGFPNVNTVGFASAYALGSLRGRVYDTNETFLRDWQTTCDCLATKVLSGTGALSPVYITSDTYTEVETDGSNNKFFTGYKGLTFGSLAEVDFFGRLSNANRLSLEDVPPGGLTTNTR